MAQTPQPQKQPYGSYSWRYLVWLIVVLVVWAWWAGTAEPRRAELGYSQFMATLRDGRVQSVVFQGDRISGVMTVAPETRESGAAEEEPAQAPEKPQTQPFATRKPPYDDPELRELLRQQDVAVQAESAEPAWWVQLLSGLLPWVLILIVLLWFWRRMQERMTGGGDGGMFGFGKSKAKRFRKGTSDVAFDDVAGLESAKTDLREVVEYLKDPDRYRSLGAKVPRGMLLMGAPGTGKTLLARAAAGEADVPFYSISGSEFIEMFVGVGAARVRDMFQSAKAESPAIVFIDELDSVGRARGTGLGGGHDEREQTLNQILNEMDGFQPHDAVVVMAATNRPDVLDKALLRPGRFDRKVVLEMPRREAREAILQVHTRQVPLSDDVDLARIAVRTVGFSGADLENLVNEAALLAGRDHRKQVAMEHFTWARDKILLGDERRNLLSDEERELVAFHEAGHALMAWLRPHADPLDKVTIIPRGRALGATEQMPEEERHNYRESYLRDRLAVMLGGRVAERVVFGELTSGAEADLKQATALARKMVSQWGMSERIGPLAFREGEEHVFLGREMTQPREFSESTAELIDQEVSRLVREIEQQAMEQVRESRSRLENLARALQERETLEGEEVGRLLEMSEG